MMKILLIEDNEMIGKLTEKMLKIKKYHVDWLKDGNEVIDYLSTNQYDLLLIDWMLPGISGIEIIKKIRNKNIDIPIIMLTAKSQTADKVTGLTFGADDYVTKPFEFEELEARILTVLKRSIPLKSQTKKIGNVTYHYQQRLFTKDNEVLELSQKEHRLLELLFLYEIVSTDLIIDKVWSINNVVTNNNVDALMRLLRKKLNNMDITFSIKNIRNVGYKLEVLK
ncbi:MULTISPECIES: response regulator transcription factor [Staphylococcaceae]|uniref:response regulator transcription factor n=1 Tax=Staphylococcaceae TaxID=90964 RepID=UPI00132FF29E|nr:MULTISPECIES: response regulator transcription factor [Staphylococcaceae]MCJ0943077.1 response regulator transcription factor [Mammaliicoccus sciuri]MCJ1750098.1 response regulator transcription factor [Mammaliicoccus sciuri]MEB8333545.1 response regulator transcription factor [Staphylococcus saprophyticus]